MSIGKKNTTSTREINNKHAAPKDTFKIAYIAVALVDLNVSRQVMKNKYLH